MAERRSAPAGREPTPGILDEAERLAVQAVFGVDADQVARDHVISHALAAIADVGLEHVIFFGGTALSRTHLPETRLSEDIDLIAVGDRREVAARLERALSRRLGRLFGAVAFTPALRDSRHPHAAVMSVGDVRVQVQLLSAIGYPSWPTEERAIRQRYSDAPPARLRVLTARLLRRRNCRPGAIAAPHGIFTTSGRWPALRRSTRRRLPCSSGGGRRAVRRASASSSSRHPRSGNGRWGISASSRSPRTRLRLSLLPPWKTRPVPSRRDPRPEL